VSAAASRATRLPAGHPEGFLEGFANIYTGVAEQIAARLEGRKPAPDSLWVPTVEHGAQGIKFISAAVESSARGGVWVPATLAELASGGR
jgi:hypothetical protein